MITKWNIQEQIASHPENRGWIMGAFIGHDSPLHSDNVEVKWAEHKKGFSKIGSTAHFSAPTLQIMISWSARLSFPSHDIEYIINAWEFVTYDTSKCLHNFEALTDCTTIIIRTPLKYV